MAHWRLGSLVDFITLPAGKDFIQVDISVTGIGSSSTITGVGNYLKEKNPNAKFNLYALCNMREGKHAAEEACRMDGSRTVRCYKHSRSEEDKKSKNR